jgi:hypothetical protein
VRTPEETQKAKEVGEREIVVHSLGSNKPLWPMIIREVNGTIRTATIEEKIAWRRHIRGYPRGGQTVSLQDRVNSIISGKKKPSTHPTEHLRSKVKFISLEDYLQRKKEDPEYHLRLQAERRKKVDADVEESARRAGELAKDIINYLKIKWGDVAEKTAKERARRRGTKDQKSAASPSPDESSTPTESTPPVTNNQATSGTKEARNF